MTQLKLNQHLKIQIDELKSFATNSNAPIIFNLTSLSFNIDEVIDFSESKERVITGHIFPNSDIYVNGAFQIEIKLPPIYPLDPPKVRFITPIYHPNVGKDGKEIYRLFFFREKYSCFIFRKIQS
jgi:ubiquitin-protein ligase